MKFTLLQTALLSALMLHVDANRCQIGTSPSCDTGSSDCTSWNAEYSEGDSCYWSGHYAICTCNGASITDLPEWARGTASCGTCDDDDCSGHSCCQPGAPGAPSITSVTCDSSPLFSEATCTVTYNPLVLSGGVTGWVNSGSVWLDLQWGQTKYTYGMPYTYGTATMHDISRGWKGSQWEWQQDVYAGPVQQWWSDWEIALNAYASGQLSQPGIIVQSDSGMFGIPSSRAGNENYAWYVSIANTVSVTVNSVPKSIDSSAFRIVATNKVGSRDSDWWRGQSTASVPSEVSYMATNAMSDTSIKISWNAPTDNGGSPIKSYTLQYAPVSAAGTFQFIINGLGGTRNLKLCPQSMNSAGCSSGDTCTHRNQDQIWKCCEVANTGCTHAGCWFKAQTPVPKCVAIQDSYADEILIPSSSTDFVLNGLQPLTEYAINIQATNLIGAGTWTPAHAVQAFAVVEGPCQVSTYPTEGPGTPNCVQSPGYPNQYKNSQNCTIQAQWDIPSLMVQHFDTEAGFDKLVVHSNSDYSSGYGSAPASSIVYSGQGKQGLSI